MQTSLQKKVKQKIEEEKKLKKKDKIQTKLVSYRSCIYRWDNFIWNFIVSPYRP